MMKESILAGIFIGLAGMSYLAIGGLLGAISFSLGLVLVCYLDIPLYTGRSGSTNDFKELFVSILLGNFIGCGLIGLLGYGCNMNPSSLESIISNRQNSTVIGALVKAILCGIIMDNIVAAYKKKFSPLPLLLGVPAFIMCGFYHCIADCFYYTLGLFTGLIDSPYICITWIVSIVGNFIGCNFRRILAYDF